jgi:hypothetical protein
VIAEILHVGASAMSDRNLYDKEVDVIKAILMKYKVVCSSALAEFEYVEIDLGLAKALRLVTGQCYTNNNVEREVHMKQFARKDDCKVIIAHVQFIFSINFLDGKHGKFTYKSSDQTHFLLKRSIDDGFTVRLLGVPGFTKSALYNQYMRERALRGYGSDWESVMMDIGRYCFTTIDGEIYEIISLTGMRQTQALTLKTRPDTTLIGRTAKTTVSGKNEQFVRQRPAIAYLLC